MFAPLPIFGHVNVAGLTQSSGTAIVQGIPPYPGPSGATPFLYKYFVPTGVSGKGLNLGTANWISHAGGGGVFTCITRIKHITGTTAKNPAILRPLNFTTVNGAVAKNTTSIVLTDDPGVYSTNYRYPSILGYPVTVADNPIANTDYFAVQLADGTWFFDKVSSMSTLTVTTTTTLPNNTTNAGGINDGALFFFFGQQSDTDPATGQKHLNWTTTASATDNDQDNVAGLFTTMRPGDPMLFLSANATDQSWMGQICGVYTKF